ncbi:hypothetical protein BayCH28_07195 [Mycolicibacterium sp. CH28]|nr:hypothetical protein BayCH28_07195 [Mycolicibacterium sp. CH28]
MAIPEGSGPWPGVVVVHDVLGMTNDLRRITDRFAASGYLALAPALYDGRGLKIKCMISTIRAHFVGEGPAYAGLLAAREHLISDSRCTGKIGLAGFCMGAGFCLQLGPSGLFNATAPSPDFSSRVWLSSCATGCVGNWVVLLWGVARWSRVAGWAGFPSASGPFVIGRSGVEGSI